VKIRKLIKEIYIPTFLKEKENKTEAKITSFIIEGGLNAIIHYPSFSEKKILFLKEIKLFYLLNEILKIFENEEYSNEVIETIRYLLYITNSYFREEDCFEYKNEILNIINILINIINNKRSEELNSIIIFYFGPIFNTIPKNEEFKNIKMKILKTIIIFLTEKKIRIKYKTLHDECDALDEITGLLKGKKKIKYFLVLFK